jgi:hypothetical protein
MYFINKIFTIQFINYVEIIKIRILILDYYLKRFVFGFFAIERKKTTKKNQIHIYILNIFFELKYVQN